jgi:hypothetical protein
LSSFAGFVIAFAHGGTAVGPAASVTVVVKHWFNVKGWLGWSEVYAS